MWIIFNIIFLISIEISVIINELKNKFFYEIKHILIKFI